MTNNIEIISENPYIYIIDNYLSDDKCNHFIDLVKNNLEQALVSDDSGGVVSKGRTGKRCWVNHNNDKITEETAKEISKLVNYPLENAESFQVIYYDKNEEYRNHCDAWQFDKSKKSERCLLSGGQRMVTALVYLNDVEKGGTTKFTKLNISVEAKKGRILVFENCIKGTNIVDVKTEHAGMPVIEGYKYAFNLWFRQQNKNKKYVHNYV
jgi:prolyl 4-hydroxylase